MVYDMETQACLQRIRPPHVPEGQTGPFALMNRNTVLDVLEIEMFKETYLYEINVANKNIRRTRLEEGIRTVYCIWSNEDRNTIGMTFLGGKEDKISGDTVYMELDADTFAEKKRVILDLDEPRSIRQNRYILDCKLRIYDLEEEKVVTQYDATLAEVDDPTKRYLYRVDFMNAHYIAIVFSDFIRILNMDTGKVANEYVYPYTSYARLDNEQKNIWIGTWEKIQILPFIDKSQI